MTGPDGTEVELKLRVDDLAALMRICVAAGSSPAFTAVQKNEYLDTAERALDGGRFVLRLREERGRGATSTFLTAKGPAVRSQDGALSTVAEEEIELGDGDVVALRSEPSLALQLLEAAPDATPARRALVSAMRAAIGPQPLQFVGAFVNERTRLDVAFPEGFAGVLELDRTHFPGDQVHHEVEFEIPHGVDHDLASSAFRALFVRAGVEGRTAPGKAKRFFAALRGESLG
jgi:uncharacterized protein YjbK